MTLDWKNPVRATVSSAAKSPISLPCRTDFRPILCDWPAKEANPNIAGIKLGRHDRSIPAARHSFVVPRTQLSPHSSERELDCLGNHEAPCLGTQLAP